MCQEVETSFLSASFSPPLPLLMPPISPIPPAHILRYTPCPCNDNSLSHVPAIIPYSRVRLASASLVVIISFSPAPLSSLSGSQILKIEIRGRVAGWRGGWCDTAGSLDTRLPLSLGAGRRETLSAMQQSGSSDGSTCRRVFNSGC